MQDKNKLELGGNMSKALAGDYNFDLQAVLKEAWSITQVTKWSLLQALLMVFSLVLLVVVISFNLIQSQGMDILDPQVQFYLELLITLLTAPLLTGLLMMGINHSVGGVSRPAHLFHFVPRTLILVLATLMTSLLVNLGLMLLVIPGLYLMIACSFTLPLVAEKGLTPWRAIYTSVRAVSHKWPQFVILYLLFAMLFMLVIATLGIALIWVGPLYYNVKGVLYRDIFGIAVRFKPDKGEKNAETVFYA
ncbi:hypothetical protein [Lacimicrobium alkaliphilum]|uniref:Glycerophosphoryl diester phosphodiesterase membrane domain-containing protein n=1 Tax=Lacimicrobium alkaliphilum TaxID=1526571 RepID=A0ABQ1R2J2_9ALTE|nr:hypothetical protein [Lacimicrobium alkaliphilum]GGD52722.1 hypothetical protein GCM10011357_05740 [Lacimicrobium alkaliphilum]